MKAFRFELLVPYHDNEREHVEEFVHGNLAPMLVEFIDGAAEDFEFTPFVAYEMDHDTDA